MNTLIGALYAIQAAMAMTDKQARVCELIMKARGVPEWSIVIDAALNDQVAFTQQSNHVVYINSHMLKNTPNTFWNVIVHEAGHLTGAQHGDGSCGMDYFVTLYKNGSICEDAARLTIPPRPTLKPSGRFH